MAHGKETRAQLRGLYVFQRLPMDAACKKLNVPRSTANRWKQEAADQGDDWDTMRTATALGDDNIKSLSAQLIEDYLVQHQATIKMLNEDKKMGPRERAETLASMGDSFNKTMGAFRRVNPELDRQAVQLDVLQRFASFAQQQYPQHLTALAEMLEPFGRELAKVR